MKVIAVVVTYNRKNLLMECLDALVTQTYPLQEIVVFDNASTDGTKEAVENSGILDNEIVKYIRHETNSGGAGGFYYGSKQAYIDGADWIWMMDDDCIPTPTALEELMKATEVVDASFLCSACYLPNGEKCNCPGLDKNDFWYKYAEHGIIKITWSTFVSFFIRRESVEKCGLPYKNFFIWSDDSEYSYRLINYYKPAYFVSKSKVIHKTASPNEWDGSLTRIKLKHYRFRNSLVVDKAYGSSKQLLKRELTFINWSFSILFTGGKYRFQKFFQVWRGIFGFWFGTYDCKAFKNRFHNIDEY